MYFRIVCTRDRRTETLSLGSYPPVIKACPRACSPYLSRPYLHKGLAGFPKHFSHKLGKPQGRKQGLHGAVDGRDCQVDLALWPAQKAVKR